MMSFYRRLLISMLIAPDLKIVYWILIYTISKEYMLQKRLSSKQIASDWGGVYSHSTKYCNVLMVQNNAWSCLSTTNRSDWLVMCPQIQLIGDFLFYCVRRFFLRLVPLFLQDNSDL